MHGLNLYDYSARYYESAIGRFTSVDPLAEDFYNWSPYTYTFNNPLRFTDPTGMAPDSLGFGSGFLKPFKELGHAIAHPIETAKGIVNYVTDTPIDQILANNLDQSSSGTLGVLSPFGRAQWMTKNSMLREYDRKNGTSSYWHSQGE